MKVQETESSGLTSSEAVEYRDRMGRTIFGADNNVRRWIVQNLPRG